MAAPSQEKGLFMGAEIAEAPLVFARAAVQNVALPPSWPPAIYTVARGSSDAAATILAYEFMAELDVPVTSLPPSVFAIGEGVAMGRVLTLVISQSGASEDLVRSAAGAKRRGAQVVAITNVPGSPVQAVADATIPIGAGPERAVPATKSVTGAVGAGLALLAALSSAYITKAEAAARALADLKSPHPAEDALVAGLSQAAHVYVIGRGAGFGAAQEIALKIKECCAIHAEAYSSSEVLHGPLQLATKPLFALVLDTDAPEVQDSLNIAEARLRDCGADVLRLSPRAAGMPFLTPAAAAVALLCLIYPAVRRVALALGHDPDRPATLSKVTQTR